MDIDFIMTWVDGGDPAWLKEKAKYAGQPAGTADLSAMRYRDWDNLRYWFRAVETFTPWVHRVFFVTCGHYPAWLNLDHPKLRFVRHEDYIPKEYLPTFSSRAIDMNFQRIDDLAEHFVYFNDDMFITRQMSETDFFIDGLPCDTAVMNAMCPGAADRHNPQTKTKLLPFTAPYFDTMVINRNFDKKACIRSHRSKWFSPKYGTAALRTLVLMPWSGFTGFMNYHLPCSYLKSTYGEVWEKEPEMLDSTCRHKFRMTTDLNHWVFTYWQLASGNFAPRNPGVGKYLPLTDDHARNQAVYDAIARQTYKMICVNDVVTGDGFETVKEALNASLEKILPEKCSFEI